MYFFIYLFIYFISLLCDEGINTMRLTKLLAALPKTLEIILQLFIVCDISAYSSTAW